MMPGDGVLMISWVNTVTLVLFTDSLLAAACKFMFALQSSSLSMTLRRF